MAKPILSLVAHAPVHDVRFGHDLRQVQDEQGVDLALLQANLALSVEERLLALEESVRFAESVRQRRDDA